MQFDLNCIVNQKSTNIFVSFIVADTAMITNIITLMHFQKTM
jgi:hypothetical protein